MGSLSSSPKPAPQPQVVYYTPAPVTPAPSVDVPSENGGDTPTAAEARTENLLRRNRGIFGTVQTSFRGFLSQSGQTGQRKSLLGE